MKPTEKERIKLVKQLDRAVNDVRKARSYFALERAVFALEKAGNEIRSKSIYWPPLFGRVPHGNLKKAILKTASKFDTFTVDSLQKESRELRKVSRKTLTSRLDQMTSTKKAPLVLVSFGEPGPGGKPATYRLR